MCVCMYIAWESVSSPQGFAEQGKYLFLYSTWREFHLIYLTFQCIYILDPVSANKQINYVKMINWAGPP